MTELNAPELVNFAMTSAAKGGANTTKTSPTIRFDVLRDETCEGLNNCDELIDMTPFGHSIAPGGAGCDPNCGTPTVQIKNKA